eukprot:2845717-Pleurochrysis_carterae.AAC.2
MTRAASLTPFLPRDAARLREEYLGPSVLLLSAHRFAPPLDGRIIHALQHLALLGRAVVVLEAEGLHRQSVNDFSFVQHQIEPR